VVEIKGPMSVRAIPAAAPAPGETVVELEYFCAGGVPSFPVLPGPPFAAATARWLPPLGHSEAWTSYATRIAPPGKPLPSGWAQLRFDLPLPGEFDAIAGKPSASAIREALRSCLDRAFPSAITDVSVSKDFVRIQGKAAPSRRGVFLADIPMDLLLDDRRSWQALVEVTPDAAGAFPIEVPAAWLKQPALLYQGKVRPVHLSENGFNSKDYSPEQLEDQAAGMALAWKKIAGLSSIESWQYHNWIDNRGEGGLRIGLRKFSDEPGDPAGPEPIWHLYKARGTPDEDRSAEPYLKTIGIRSWDEIIHRGPIR
jgi:hypothetical protein